MALVTINDSTLTDIADSIRSKLGVETTYKPSEMPEAIESISSGGITPTGTIEITQNGVVDVTNYASADVDVSGGVTPTGTKSITANGTGIDVAAYAYADVAVPNSYASGDEGKVVSNGALVAQTSDTVTANDTYDTTLINSLTVNVSGGGGSHNLPSAYIEYEYIEGTGTQWIDSGYIPTADSEIVATTMRTASQSYNACDWGLKSAGNAASVGNYWSWGNAGDKTGGYNPDQIFGPLTVRVNIQGVYDQANVKQVNFGTVTWQTATKSIYLMSRNNNGSAERVSKVRLYYWSAYENGVKQIELIPAMRKSDSELGLYDTVGNTFLTNSGSGDFVGGTL